MPQNKETNVTKFRRFRPDLGTLVFGFVFLYILICVVIYFTRDHVAIYQVKTGEIVENQMYTGLVLRTEQLFYSENSGYLTYIGREGSRVSPQSTVYVVGSTANTPSDESGASYTFTSEDYAQLFQEIEGFQTVFETDHFATVYNFKSSFYSTVLNTYQAGQVSNGLVSGALSSALAKASGVLVYSYDGLENVTYEAFEPSMLNNNDYELTTLKGREQISDNEPVYKLITDEPWEIIIELDDTTAAKYVDDQYVEVRFLKDQNTVWGQISKFERDDTWYCRLKFTNSMVRYATERYLEIEVMLDSQRGLKIPNSAIEEKKFYTVPIEYLMTNELENQTEFRVTKVDKKGNTSVENIQITPYYTDQEFAYISMDDLTSDITQIIHPETGALYTIGQIGTLSGVYNVNKGYAVFNVITVLYKNDDYSIVKANETYGLTQYDRIALDGSSVEDDQVIY